MRKYLLLMCFVILPVGCTEDEVVVPVACFTIMPSSPVPLGGSISFTNCSQDATEFHWDFDDGSTSSEKDPTHTYTQTGSYEIVLIAYNGSSSGAKTPSDTTMLPITVVRYAKSKAGQ